ncbi:Vacuolar membrane amino acid uptake transporter fnx2 [Pleurostoma richardsiae]|uniref:Vacuolar membrane amino acid uptake transporter fnx2 n=1 Tax=Pleurostoma richardsiae TaxID=41990 RepID=A0AA38RDQ3_9PEZI|nr:Vacuolar membrane amino acid uptake transporter fnx2 [Pleurostoma richardsiae]
MGQNDPGPSEAPSLKKESEYSPLLNNQESASISEAYATFAPSSSTDSSDDSARASLSSDEESLGGSTPVEGAPPQLPRAAVLRIIFVLLLAVFVFNADSSLVMATHPIIASEFNALESSSWLVTGFGLAGSATQVIFGKLSDIYGRKPIILFCYIVFAIGCLIVGMGQSMVMVILGRVLSGSVGAGMSVLVSILITDLIPIREVATWRAYVNVAATTGRGVGGPLGGYLADLIGWRYSFIGQAPLLLLAVVLCWIYLPAKTQRLPDLPSKEDGGNKLARVDFLGSALLGLLILCFLLPLEIGGVKVPWTHPAIPALFGSAAVLTVLFIVAEKRWAREPILPLELFTRKDTVLSLLVMILQAAAQLGLMFCVPLYFQVTMKVSSTEAGTHLLPAFAGNAIGAILSGVFINRTGKYKWLIYFATLSAALSYSLLLLRWHGKTNWWEALYIFPGGFGTGMAQSVIFISLQAAVEPHHIAPAVSALYLSTGLGAIVGLASMSALLQQALRKTLESRLLALGLEAAQRAEIISSAVSSVDYIFQAKGKIAEAVVASYVDGLWYTHGMSLALSLLAFFLSLPLKEYKL